MSAVAELAPQANDYEWWQRALRGEEVGGPTLPVHDGEANCGFYRRRTRRAGPFVPVAIWRDGDGLVCLVDGKQVDPVNEWTYCCRHPISEAHYYERVNSGKWHDEAEAVSASLAHDANNSGDVDEAEVLQDQINAASAGAAEYAEISDDETAAKAQGLRSRLLELSGNADRLREDRKRPHLEAGKAIDAKLMPLVKAAKTAADAIRAALGAHETRKAREAEKVRLAAEAARLKAEKEAAPSGAVAAPPAPPTPAPVPEQSVAIRGAYGRAAAVKVVKVARVVDQDAAYMAMRDHKELVELIAKLAQRAAVAGVAVAGVEVTEERVVS